jgi:prolyl-tRNA editing enzyme YbaK/EbsC (Cys-tRNA(Pro) deacylase)
VGIHPPRLPDPTAEAVEPVGHSRRGFLTRVAVGGAVLAVGTQVVPTGGLLPLGAQEDDPVVLDADETTVQFLASIALAAADAHRAGADVAGIPETTVEVIRSFGANHRSQAAAFNGVIPEEAEVTVPNETLLGEATAALAGADGEEAVLTVLRDMTEQIAATQLAALESGENQFDARTIAAALGTVSQQAVVLAVLGGESVEAATPATQTTDGALTVADYPVSFPDEEGAAEDAPAEEGSTTTAGEDADTTTTTTEG